MKKSLLSLLVLSLSTLLIAGCTNKVEPVEEELVDETAIVEENVEEAVEEEVEEVEEAVEEEVVEAEEAVEEEVVEVVAE